MTSERDLASFMADFFDKIDRHKDIINSIKKMILLDPKLNESERNLFTEVYKNAIRPLRTTLQIMQECFENMNPSYVKYIDEYKSKILNEMEIICKEFIGYIDNELLPVTNDSKSILFYETIKAGFYRYLIECKSNDEKTEFVCKAKQCYEKAVELANKICSGVEPTYQKLFFNYCIFLYEILGQKMEAIRIASHAIDVSNKAYDELYAKYDCFGPVCMSLAILEKEYLIPWKNEMDKNE